MLVFGLNTGNAYSQSVPPLGAASTFAILGGTTVTATGIDTISGDIGVSPGTAVTGFPPGIVQNGAIYSGAGSKAGPAQASAASAFDYLAAESYPAANDLSGKTLGVSPGCIVLTPGVYHFGAATTLSGTLTLNDGGNANAIFIIQIGSALTTGANSSVVMTSGGVGKNVYWQIGSSATFGASTAFCGNLIAFTAITMNPGAFTTGRVFALNAAVTVNGTTIQAVSKTWTGGANTKNWGDANNWNAIGVPKITDNVDLTDADTININVVAYSKNLLIANPKLLLIIQANQSLTVSKIFRLTAGHIINYSNLIFYGPIRDSAGRIESTGTVTINSSTADTIAGKMFTDNLTGNLVLKNSLSETLDTVVNVRGVLLVTGGQLNTKGFLVLASDSMHTGQIDGSSTGTIAGLITQQRYLKAGFGYKYFSSPVQTATVGAFANNVVLSAFFPNFYSYDETQVATGWQVDTIRTSTLVPLQGYAANFGPSTAPKLVSITGTMNNGPVSISLSNTNQAITQGFNLVGNPYPSPINWNATSGWTKINVDNALYYFDAGTTSQYTGTYSSYVNGISSDGKADSLIASMQGFFVHVTNGTYPVAATLAVTNQVRINNDATLFHRATLNLSQPANQVNRFGVNSKGIKQRYAMPFYKNSQAMFMSDRNYNTADK